MVSAGQRRGVIPGMSMREGRGRAVVVRNSQARWTLSAARKMNVSGLDVILARAFRWPRECCDIVSRSWRDLKS